MDDSYDDPPAWAKATWPARPAGEGGVAQPASPARSSVPSWPAVPPEGPRPIRPRRPLPRPPVAAPPLPAAAGRRPGRLGGVGSKAGWLAGGRAARRAVQHVAIPAAAAGLVAWGAFGVDLPVLPNWQAAETVPPAAPGVALAPTQEAALAAEAEASPAATASPSPSPTPLPPLLTWPATPAAPTGTPIPSSTPAAAAPPPSFATRTAGPNPTPGSALPTRPAPTAVPTPVSVAGCAEPAAPPPAAGGRSRETTADVNLRRQPGLDCQVLRVLPAGAEVEVLSGEVRADGRGWLRVRASGGGETGWVAADLLRGR